MGDATTRPARDQEYSPRNSMPTEPGEILTKDRVLCTTIMQKLNEEIWYDIVYMI